MRTSDWSSDVCSSDLPLLLAAETLARPRLRRSGPETAVRAGQRRDHRAGRAHRLCGGAAAAAADGRLHERTAFRSLAAATRSRTAGAALRPANARPRSRTHRRHLARTPPGPGRAPAVELGSSLRRESVSQYV